MRVFRCSNNGVVNQVDPFFQAGAADVNPSVSRGDAIVTAERLLDGGRPETLEFFVQPDGFAAFTHVV